MTPEQVRANQAAWNTVNQQNTAMSNAAVRRNDPGGLYRNQYSGIQSAFYPNSSGQIRYQDPQAYNQAWTSGKQVAFPNRADFANDAEFQMALNNWWKQADIAMADPKWLANSRGQTGGGGGAVGGGRAVDPNAGTTLPSLPPELERWYQEQLSQARTEEEQAMAQARLARRAALLQAAEQARAARRAATTGAMDVGAAMAGVGLGTSPAILGAALDQVYGTGGAGVMAADAARTSALENFLREETGITGQGRRRRGDLEDWRALQIAALSNEDLAKLISGSPLGGR